LNFGREVLQTVKEGKWSSGEGRRIEWNPKGEEYAVAFERGAVVFGTDAKPQCCMLPAPLTKVHQMRYLTLKEHDNEELLALSTEDGRILFYATGQESAIDEGESSGSPVAAQARAQLGGKLAGIPSRIKDFEILHLHTIKDQPQESLIVTASSDGAVRVWTLNTTELLDAVQPKANGTHFKDLTTSQEETSPRQVGKLIGTHETGNRITCLAAFVMLPGLDDDDQPEETGDESELASESESSDFDEDD